jgi:hypothetical protein
MTDHIPPRTFTISVPVGKWEQEDDVAEQIAQAIEKERDRLMALSPGCTCDSHLFLELDYTNTAAIARQFKKADSSERV